MEQAMNNATRDNSQWLVRFKQQYVQWRKRV